MQIALKSLCTQQVSVGRSFEVIVVDNASQDDTRQRVRELAEDTAHPRIRYVYEPNVGLSHARNRGIAEAEADIIAFLDDDAAGSTALDPDID